MRAPEIEAWTLAVLERLARRQVLEDSRVELKAEWPSPPKAARRLAGQANALSGDPLLWIIGADESRGVSGAPAEELSVWWNQVRSQFDGIAPELTDLIVPSGAFAVHSLLFTTDRAPFVVKNPEGGSIQREVPWREGTAVRSATRSELLRLLVPSIAIPEIEVLGARFSIITRKDSFGSATLDIHLYFVPRTPERLVIPFHRCTLTLRTLDGSEIGSRLGFRLGPSHVYSGSRAFNYSADSPPSYTITPSPTELILTGPGQASIEEYYRDEPSHFESVDDLFLDLTLSPALAPRAWSASLHLRPSASPSPGLLAWDLFSIAG